jgi:hypothetical protein
MLPSPFLGMRGRIGIPIETDITMPASQCFFVRIAFTILQASMPHPLGPAPLSAFGSTRLPEHRLQATRRRG